MLYLLYFIIIVLIAIFFFLRYNPAFGGKQNREKVSSYNQSPNFSDGKFLNIVPANLMTRTKRNPPVVWDLIRGNRNSRPHSPIPVEQFSPLSPQDKHKNRVTWFGHSAVLVEVAGRTLFLDPMLGKVPSPIPIVVGKRYSENLPAKIRDLPQIDAVLISHDHYDHLDYDSILKLKDKVKRFLVPLGVGSHLERWGIERARIQEFDWWDEIEFEGLKVLAAPARHFSGRSLTDRNTTLWCSWVINSKQASIFYSGDGGYGQHFQEIGSQHGPFDLTLIECGQYDHRWADIHMLPEEAVQAHLDVKGKVMLPVHWGAFTLAFHDWDEPVERILGIAEEKKVAVTTPKIGEPVETGTSKYPISHWWK